MARNRVNAHMLRGERNDFYVWGVLIDFAIAKFTVKRSKSLGFTIS